MQQSVTSETNGYLTQPVCPSRMMPIKIDGLEYFTAADILREMGVVRQTLWRWRRARVIPQGLRYRRKAIVFTRAEVEAIREYSNRLEPADSSFSRRSEGASRPRQRRQKGKA